MLVAVDVVRRRPAMLCEGIELAIDLAGQRLAIDQVQVAGDDPPRQAAPQRGRGEGGEVEVQADVQQPAVGQRPQGWRIGGPGRPEAHDRHGLQPALGRELQDAFVDGAMQAKIVGADAQLPLPRMSTGAHGRFGWFVAVGCAAAGVHWCVAMLLIGQFGCPPLLANLGAWLVALSVSIGGHHRLSFRGHGGPLGRAALRFVALSALSFLINETAYALLLAWAPRHYGLLLAAVLVGVAGLTYLLSRHWAFARTAPE